MIKDAKVILLVGGGKIYIFSHRNPQLISCHGPRFNRYGKEARMKNQLNVSFFYSYKGCNLRDCETKNNRHSLGFWLPFDMPHKGFPIGWSADGLGEACWENSLLQLPLKSEAWRCNSLSPKKQPMTEALFILVLTIDPLMGWHSVMIGFQTPMRSNNSKLRNKPVYFSADRNTEHLLFYQITPPVNGSKN